MDSKKRVTYSRIIDPETFNQIMTKEHLYIAQADQIVRDMIGAETNPHMIREVVELGCGPARLTRLIVDGVRMIRVTAIDHDEEFIKYGQKLLGHAGRDADLVCADVTTYQHSHKVDVFYSQGTHHHIPKVSATDRYLRNVYRQLKPGGCYILSDEFLAPYVEDDRKIVMVMWYSHIIAAALKSKYEMLAVEEAKTLLDDLVEANDPDWVKTQKQIDLVLESVADIENAAEEGMVTEARLRAARFLKELEALRSTKPTGNSYYDLSRGDYKISGAYFRHEVAVAGFEIETVRHLGPIDVSGGFSIYLLRKPR